MSKPLKLKQYVVSVRLVLDVGVTVAAESLAAAVLTAEDMKIMDIVDFEKNNWEHHDSQPPVVYGAYGV